MAIGVVWGYLPNWNFYLSLLLGFAVAEAMAYTSKGKRGTDLQIAGIAAVVLGLAISRVVMANRYGISWPQINDMSQSVLYQGGFRPVSDLLYLRFIPDGLFAALAALIVWYRFR